MWNWLFSEREEYILVGFGSEALDLGRVWTEGYIARGPGELSRAG